MGWFDGRSSTSSSHYYVRRRSPSRKGYSTYYSRSAPSIFSSFSSSSRRARPRAGFIQHLIHSIKRLLRDIYRYLRRHPLKVFLLVILPLLTSGVLPKLLGMVGLRLPPGVLNALGGSAANYSRGELGAIGGSGLSENVNRLMNIAKMFA